MSIHSNKACGVLVTLIIALIQLTVVNAQTSAFTYQGRLNDSGTSPNATYEMEFKLFDGAGAQVGSTITKTTPSRSKTVSSLFSSTSEPRPSTVPIDFWKSVYEQPEVTMHIRLLRLVNQSLRHHTQSEPARPPLQTAQ